jgi:hypothetical protein
VGLKLSLSADDIAGIQSIYGSRPRDAFDAVSSNDTKGDASVITSSMDSNKQITLTNLDLTGSSDVDWYKVVTPSGSAPTMVVKVQSTGLSLLAPKVTLFKGSTQKGTASGSYHSTISDTESIGGGQSWFIKVEAAESSVFGIGKYALQVNMGTAALPTVNGPNTATPVTGFGGNGSPMVETDAHAQAEPVIFATTDSHPAVDQTDQVTSSSASDSKVTDPSSDVQSTHHVRLHRDAPAGSTAVDLILSNSKTQRAIRVLDALLDAGLIDAVSSSLGR